MSSSIHLDPASPFSVVIPMYNAARTIGRALESVARQNLAPREVVVVDDGSTDDGAELVGMSRGVTLLRQPQSGPGHARNRGAHATTGPWIAFLDSDDVWFPEHLSVLAHIKDTFPEAGLISSGHRQVSSADLALREQPKRMSVRRIDYLRTAGRNIDVVWTSAAAVRKDVFGRLDGFPPDQTGEDLDLWARIALQHPVAVTRRVTALYVRGSGGLMQAASAESLRRLNNAPRGSLPAGLRDVSPSVRSMLRALEAGGHGADPRSIELYIDGRITAGWIGVIVHRTQVASRIRLRQLHHPWHPTAWPYRAAAWLPLPAARFIGRLITRRRARRR